MRPIVSSSYTDDGVVSLRSEPGRTPPMRCPARDPPDAPFGSRSREPPAIFSGLRRLAIALVRVLVDRPRLTESRVLYVSQGSPCR